MIVKDLKNILPGGLLINESDHIGVWQPQTAHKEMSDIAGITRGATKCQMMILVGSNADDNSPRMLTDLLMSS